MLYNWGTMAKILIVDNPGDASLVESILHRQGHDIRLASSVRSAREMLNAHLLPDLVICEMQLKGQSGQELLAYISQSRRLKFLPSIFCSSDTNREAIVRIMKAGASDFILKPIREEELIPRIDRALQFGRPEVLVVDDEHFILDLLRKILEREGFIVHTADAAEKGLEILNSHLIDVVVSDILLPGMNGIELLVKIKEQFPFMPVLLITGHSGRFSATDALSHGAEGYITKPFQNVEIVQKLIGWVDRSRRKTKSMKQGVLVKSDA